MTLLEKLNAMGFSMGYGSIYAQHPEPQLVKPNVFYVLFTEFSIARRALSTAIRDLLFHALLAVHVSTAHDDALLVAVMTNGTCQSTFQKGDLSIELFHRKIAVSSTSTRCT